MEIFMQLIANGILLGGTLAIVSIGLTLIFGIVRVVNFAHGEFLMIGFYIIYLLNKHIGFHPYLLILPTMIILFIMGAMMQRFIIQPLLTSEPHIQIFATVGVSTALLNAALLIFGADVYTTNHDSGIGVGAINLWGLHLNKGQIITLLFSILLMLCLNYFLRNTYLGRAVRATAQNRDAAQLMGVNVNFIYIFTFGLGTACLGLSSGLMAPSYPVFPTLGTFFILTAFVIVVLGGLGSICGAFAGAMIIGIVDSLSGYYLSPDLKEVVSFGIFLLILILRPTGIFGAGRGSE